MKKKIFFLSFVIITVFAKAQIPPTLATQLQGVLNNAVSSGGNHGVSAHLILQSGQTWDGTAGVDAIGNSITDTTVFITASISKLNIATLLLLFQENGIIDLDDTWHKYLPTLNVAFDTNITIRQLLNHTSGIADYLEVPANAHYVTSNFSTYYTPKYILENIVSGVPDFTRGTNFNYSNSNYCLAAYVAEAATPNALKDELRTRVWNPVGMKHTYFGAYEPIPMPRAGVWWNFGSGITNYSSKSDTSMLSFGYGTDNVVTCPTDLAKLVNAIVNNNLLNAQSMSEMMTFIPQSVYQWTGPYGLGIHHLLGQTVDTLLGHDGKFCNQSDVFHSNMCGFTLAAMTNSETLWEGIYNPMYNVIRNYYQCNTTPVANFHANHYGACIGSSIVFSDSSTNWKPTSWHWDFPGGTLIGGTTVNDSMPQVTYTVPGIYAVSYTASTLGGSNSITKNSCITISSNTPSYNSSFFEGFETTTLPNSDWSIKNTKGLDWAVTSIGAATGNQSVYIDNFSNQAGNTSSLISTTFDISSFNAAAFSFKMAYQQKVSSGTDKLQIFTSTDCGNTWVSRWARSGSGLATVTPSSPVPLYPSPSQFNTYTVNINGVSGSSNVKFKFDFIADASAPGNYLFLDDINLFDAALGIKTNETKLDFEIYPNPSLGSFYIKCTKDINNIKVTNLLGQKIYETIPNSNQTVLQIDNPGVYFVSVINGKETGVRKVIVNK